MNNIEQPIPQREAEHKTVIRAVQSGIDVRSSMFGVVRVQEGAPPFLSQVSGESKPRHSQGRRLLVLAVLTVFGAAGTLLYFVIDPARVAIVPPCMFHELTGMDCPGCGGQRAFHQLLHGDVIEAFRFNAMFVVSLPLFAWMGTRFLVRYLKGQVTGFQSRWWWLYLAAWIAFGVLRNLPGFTWFAP